MGKAPTNGGYPIFIFDYQKVSLSWFLVSCHLLEAPFPMAEAIEVFQNSACPPSQPESGARSAHPPWRVFYTRAFAPDRLMFSAIPRPSAITMTGPVRFEVDHVVFKIRAPRSLEKNPVRPPIEVAWKNRTTSSTGIPCGLVLQNVKGLPKISQLKMWLLQDGDIHCTVLYRNTLFTGDISNTWLETMKFMDRKIA